MVVVFGPMRVEFEPPTGSALHNLPGRGTVATPTPASFRLTFSLGGPGGEAGPVQLGLFGLDGERELPALDRSVKTGDERVGFEMPRGTLVVKAVHGEQQAKLVLAHTGLKPTWTGQVFDTTPG